MMSRILFVSTAGKHLSWGGSEVLWASVADRLLTDGHHVAFSYQYWPDEPAPLAALRARGAVAYYQEDPAASAMSARLKRHWRRLQAQADFPCFDLHHWLLSIVMLERPDLVVFTACDAYNTITEFDAPVARLRKQGIPYAIICQLEDENQIILSWRREKMRRMYGGAVSVSFGSEQGARLIERQLAMKLPDVEIFMNPANTDRMIKSWPVLAPGAPIRMACVGRLDVSQKGQDMLFEVLARPAWMARNWKLTLYGRGGDEDYLRDLVRMLDLESRVTLAGYQPNVARIWEKEMICLQPSHREGTPMTVVEAMYAGRPCLVSDRARMPDLIQHGKSGWITSPTVNGLAVALEQAWDQWHDWPEMGHRAHASIAASWDPDYAAGLARKFGAFARAGRNV